MRLEVLRCSCIKFFFKSWAIRKHIPFCECQGTGARTSVSIGVETDRNYRYLPTYQPKIISNTWTSSWLSYRIWNWLLESSLIKLMLKRSVFFYWRSHIVECWTAGGLPSTAVDWVRRTRGWGCAWIFRSSGQLSLVKISVGDDPDMQDPHVFGPPGSGSIIQRCGSGFSFGSCRLKLLKIVCLWVVLRKQYEKNFCILKVAEERSRIRRWIWIRFRIR